MNKPCIYLGHEFAGANAIIFMGLGFFKNGRKCVKTVLKNDRKCVKFDYNYL